MFHITKGEILVCAFIVYHNENYKMIFEHFIVGENEIIENRDFLGAEIKFDNSSIIKSAVNYNHTKSIFCIYITDGYTNCLTYNINFKEENEDRNNIFYYNETKCNEQYSGYNVDYYFENYNND